MNMHPFTGRCHTCGHDHDAERGHVRVVLDIIDKARDAEIAALRAEVAKVRKRCAEWALIAGEHGAEKDSLRAEVERLRKDAERWRFIRGCLWTGELNPYSADRQWLWGTRFSSPLSTENIDAAIDAAMSEPKPAP